MEIKSLKNGQFAKASCPFFLLKMSIMMPFGDILGEFQLFIVCYMYIILVDVKKYLLGKGLYLD